MESKWVGKSPPKKERFESVLVFTWLGHRGQEEALYQSIGSKNVKRVKNEKSYIISFVLHLSSLLNLIPV